MPVFGIFVPLDFGSLIINCKNNINRSLFQMFKEQH